MLKDFERRYFQSNLYMNQAAGPYPPQTFKSGSPGAADDGHGPLR